jgi:hypothetical protein
MRRTQPCTPHVYSDASEIPTASLLHFDRQGINAMTYQGERARPLVTEVGRCFEVSKVRLSTDDHVSQVLWGEVDAWVDQVLGTRTVASAAEVVDAIHDGAQVTLETAVGHGRVRRDAVRQQGATTRRAHARKAKQRSWRAVARCNRLCSALTNEVNGDVRKIRWWHRDLHAAQSGQLPFQGLQRYFDRHTGFRRDRSKSSSLPMATSALL